MLWRWQLFEIWAIESVINVIFVKAAVPTWPVIVAVNVHPKWWLYILSVNRKRNWIRAKRYRRIWPALGIKLPSSEVEVWNLTPTRFPLFYCLGKKKCCNFWGLLIYSDCLLHLVQFLEQYVHQYLPRMEYQSPCSSLQEAQVAECLKEGIFYLENNPEILEFWYWGFLSQRNCGRWEGAVIWSRCSLLHC